MKVRELLDALQKLDPELEVVTENAYEAGDMICVEGCSASEATQYGERDYCEASASAEDGGAGARTTVCLIKLEV